MNKSKVSRFFQFLICVLLSLVVGPPSSEAQSEQSFQNVNIAVQAIRQAHGILTGLEIPAADEANKSPIIVDLSGKDLTHVFDLLAARRPAYAWSLQDGVYDVYPRKEAGSLSQVNVVAFVATNNTLEEAKDALFNLPEVRKWFFDHQARRGGGGEYSGLGPGPGGPFPEPKRISLSLANVKLATILNQLISKFDRRQWIIGHLPVKGQYREYVSIEL